MRRFTRLLFVGAAAAVAVALSAGGATASVGASDEGSGGDTAVINGREYGPADGLTVEGGQFAITPGGDPVGVVLGTTALKGIMTPMVTWGSSYATSTETAELYYTGRAKAAANIYSGQRIIQVCFWYTRGGSAISGTYCSNASSNGSSWSAGPEVSHGVWDSLVPGESNTTYFKYKYYRIDPQVL